MVLSETPVARRMYYKVASSSIALNPLAILRGCRTAISEGRRLILEPVVLGDEQYARWRLQAEKLKNQVGL